jgi:hypothetical protein
MSNLDVLDVLKNIENMHENNTAFNVLKDFERVLDELDLYVYKNWMDGEIASGPDIDRHWITCKFFWKENQMPDPMGGKRLVDYDCKVSYEKTYFIKPKKIESQDDFRPGTKKGKLEAEPIWVVEIKMPKNLIADFYDNELEDLEIKSEETPGVDQDLPVEAAATEPVSAEGGEPVAGEEI